MQTWQKYFGWCSCSPFCVMSFSSSSVHLLYIDSHWAKNLKKKVEFRIAALFLNFFERFLYTLFIYSSLFLLLVHCETIYAPYIPSSCTIKYSFFFFLSIKYTLTILIDHHFYFQLYCWRVGALQFSLWWGDSWKKSSM